jgi:hypothetical protein
MGITMLVGIGSVLIIQVILFLVMLVGDVQEASISTQLLNLFISCVMFIAALTIFTPLNVYEAPTGNVCIESSTEQFACFDPISTICGEVGDSGEIACTSVSE